MSVDVTSIVIEAKSEGIAQATKDLKALAEAATLVEGKAKIVKEATSGLSSVQVNAVADIEKMIAKFQKQADLLGANTSQMNAYQVAMKNGSQLEQQMAAMLGAEVDAYKAKAVAQTQAIADNKALDASYKKLQQGAEAFYASQAKAQAAGNALNQAGQREQELKKIADAQRALTKTTNELATAETRQKAIQQNRDVEMQVIAYNKLSVAQTEALKINSALNASQTREKAIQQARDVEMHAMSYQKLAAAQAEALKMNNAYDASVRKLRLDEAARHQALFNNSMREGHDIARGLSGALGALWLTYGSIGAMIGGVIIGASLKSIVSIGKDVENTLEGIRVRGEESVASINKMRESIVDLGKGVYGPKEVAQAFDVLILAGLRADQALIGIKDALNLATVGGTNIEKAAIVLVQVSTALGYTAEGFGRISDVIAKTAAVSISSVDGISESFKSASVVGKLYGQSLVDLGTQFAILSNLGIKNTAAGTASKNFFSDLASGTDKVTHGLSILKLSIQDLQDKQGNFLSFNEVLRKLAGDSEKGFNSLTAASQKYVQTLITNERGNKLMTEGLDLIRQKGKETATALDDISKSINESWGFTAQGAAAMALTVDAQFKSVKNTLQTQLGQAFVEIQPQLSLVATRLKAAFGSPEFLSGVQALATGVANMTVFVVENAQAFWEVARALLAFKAAATIIGVLTGVAEGFVAVKTALDLAKISAVAFQAALGLVGLALAAGAGLLVWWATKRDEAFGTKQQAALNYMDDFKGKLDEENKRLEKQIELMKKGKTATDAFTEAQQRMQLQKIKEQGQNAVGDAEKNLSKTYYSLTDYQREGVTNYQKGVMPKSGDGAQITAIQAMGEATKKLLDVKKAVKKAEDETQLALDKHVSLSRQAAELAEKQAKARNITPDGTNKLLEEVSKAAINDAFQKQLQTYQNQINQAKKQVEQEKALAQSQYTQGLLGEAGLIEANYTSESNFAQKAIKLIQDKIDATVGAENKLALAEKFKGDLTAQNDALEAAKAKRSNSYAEMEVSNQQKIQKYTAERYTAQGAFAAAYEAEFKAKHDIQVTRLNDDIAKEVDAVRKGEAEKVLAYLKSDYEAGKAHAQNKEALASFTNLAEATRNSLKGIQTANEGQGLAAMFAAASAASKTLADNMDVLVQRGATLTDPKMINEAQAQLINLAETQRKLWAGVGESISKSLESAFGKSGKAAGDLLKVAVNYSNLEEKSGSARVKAYGDAAGAAKGFFKEGTTGYKILENAERAFRLLELAGMVQSLVTTGTIEAGKQALKVPTVLMEFMSWMGPWGLAAGAAAIAAIGVSASSGGGTDFKERQKTQGAGSVLGSDAQSESIAHSLTVLEKNSGLGLTHSNTMIGYLKTVADGISGLAAALAQVAGVGMGKIPGITESTPAFFQTLFGATKTTIKDQGITAAATTLGNVQQNGINASSFADVEKSSWWGLSKSNSTTMNSLGADVNNRIKLIIESMAKTVTTAAESLGMGGDAFTAHLKTFIVDIGNISTKGMSGEEIEKTFSAVFSKLGDDMAAFALSGVVQFQKLGEGLLETVSRVVNDLVQVEDVFAVLDKSFNLTGLAAVNVSENLIAAAGGLDKLTNGTKFFVDNFLTEDEKMGPITASVTKRMTELGLSGITTIDSFKKIVRGLDLTSEADQKLYGALIDIAPAFKDAADYAAKAADTTKALAASQELVGKAKSNLDSAYQREATALQSVIDKFKSFSDTLKKFKDSLLTGALSTLSPEEKYLQSKSKFESTSSLAAKGDAGALADLQNVSQQFLDASRGYNASSEAYVKDFGAVQTALDRSITAADSQVSIAQSQLDVMKASYEALVGIQTVLSFKDAVSQYKDTSSNAIEGLYGSILGRHSDESGMAFWQKQLANGMSLENISQLIMGSQEKIDGSHFNGLDSVPKDNYLARLHKGERVQTAKAANASDENSTKLVELTEKLLERISNLESEAAASTTQRASISGVSTEQMEILIKKMEDVKRAVVAK